MERDGLCRRTLDRLLEGCQIVGRDFRYLYVNDVVVRHARQPREALIGRTMMEAYPGIDETPLFDVIRRVMQGGPPEHLENFFEFPDGTSGWFELSVQPVPDGVCILSIDITERVTAQRLSHRRQRLESLGTLAGGVAHDLNNALSPITMSVGLLRDAGGADEDLLASVEESAGRAARLVRQLLTFSKGSDGERLPIAPQQLLGEMERFIRRSFPKAITPDVRVADRLPDVRGDATQLHQVLLNLCINARDAMPDGGTLTLEAAVVDVDAAYASTVLDGRPGRFVCLIVRDTGAGIPPEVLDRIFEPFFTTKGPDSGTGLGLSTTLGIVRSHGGFMHVYSEPNRGTTFRVFLPVVADPPPVPAEAPPPPLRGGGRTVLVVDDDAQIRKAVTSVLAPMGFTVVTTLDGTDALRWLAGHRSAISVVVLDLQMPNMDGRTLYARLRTLIPDVPVIITSGRVAADQAADWVFGDSPYLPKPFTQDDLVRSLRAALSDRPH